MITRRDADLIAGGIINLLNVLKTLSYSYDRTDVEPLVKVSMDIMASIRHLEVDTDYPAYWDAVLSGLDIHAFREPTEQPK